MSHSDCPTTQCDRGGGWKKGGNQFRVHHPDRTVWLGNLNGSSYQDVQNLLNQVGSCKKVQVLKTGSTGFALMGSEAEAQAAIGSLNGSVLNGTSIEIDSYTKKSKN